MKVHGEYFPDALQVSSAKFPAPVGGGQAPPLFSNTGGKMKSLRLVLAMGLCMIWGGLAWGLARASVAEAELTDQEKAKLAERINAKALDEFQTKLAKALEDLKKILTQPGAKPVYVAGGKAFQLTEDGKTQEIEHEAAQPYAWKLAHDVRPARQSLGATGCFDCHQLGAPIFEGQVTAVSPVLDEQPRKYAMYELAGFDKFKLDAWNQSFQGRTAFKWLGFASMGVVSLVLLWYAMRGLTSLAGACRWRKA